MYTLPIVMMIGVLYLYVEMTNFPGESSVANAVVSQNIQFSPSDVCVDKQQYQQHKLLIHRHWEEGKCMVFDDSYEHEVKSHSVRQSTPPLPLSLLSIHLPTYLPTSIHTYPGLKSHRFGACFTISGLLAS